MKRREFIALLGGAAAAWPLAARAQQARKVLRIGVLLAGTPTSFAPRVQAFFGGVAGPRLCRGENRRHRVEMGTGLGRSAAGSRRRVGETQGRYHCYCRDASREGTRERDGDNIHHRRHHR
jgi:hypothetical protein